MLPARYDDDDDDDLSHREIEKVNVECDQGVGFDNTFKANNYILSIVSKPNRMID